MSSHSLKEAVALADGVAYGLDRFIRMADSFPEVRSLATNNGITDMVDQLSEFTTSLEDLTGMKASEIESERESERKSVEDIRTEKYEVSSILLYAEFKLLSLIKLLSKYKDDSATEMDDEYPFEGLGMILKDIANTLKTTQGRIECLGGDLERLSEGVEIRSVRAERE